jgi:hypothetical protein
LPWHRQRYDTGCPGLDDALLRLVLGLPTPARCFAGAAQVVLLPCRAWPTSRGFARAVCPDPPQGLGPQLAPAGCQREAQAQGDHRPPAYQGGCLRCDPLDRRGNIRDLATTFVIKAVAIIGAIGEAVVACGHEVSHGARITEPGEIPTRVRLVVFLGARGPVGRDGRQSVPGRPHMVPRKVRICLYESAHRSGIALWIEAEFKRHRVENGRYLSIDGW